jgi:TatD DNase family protein
MWIDSHCHLNHERIADHGSPAALTENARKAGVSGMVNICCRIADEFPLILKTAQGLENVWCTIGTHPHEAGKPEEQVITLETLISLANSDPKIVGIGESGLDYYYNHAPVEDQKASFRKHIRACIETDLPLVVHARDADADVMQIIREEGAGTKLKGVLHCFSSGRAMAEDALDFGFYISLSGIVTFKQAEELQATAKDVPLDRILVETDSPFLAPVPLRGKTNEPAYVTHTGTFVAGLKNIAPDELARITTDNFFKLFSRAGETYRP